MLAVAYMLGAAVYWSYTVWQIDYALYAFPFAPVILATDVSIGSSVLVPLLCLQLVVVSVYSIFLLVKRVGEY